MKNKFVCRASEIWTAYQREGGSSLEPKKRGFQKGTPPLPAAEERAGGRALYAVRGFHEPAASDPIYGPAGSDFQPKGFSNFGQVKGASWEEDGSLTGQASGEN